MVALSQFIPYLKVGKFIIILSKIFRIFVYLHGALSICDFRHNV
jgi:hypothetical protein